MRDPFHPRNGFSCFRGDRETRREPSNQERRRAMIQIELTHEAQDAQSQAGNDEGWIA